MNEYIAQLESAVRAVQFHSPTTYLWFGQGCDSLPRTAKRLTNATARTDLLFNLQSRLYQAFYCLGFADSSPTGPDPFPRRGATDFVEALSAANSGRGCWENGWEVHRIEGERLRVHRGGLELFVTRRDCLFGEGHTALPGTPVSIRLPKELLGFSPGFYTILGEVPYVPDDQGAQVRLYWHITAEGAVPFVRRATSLLNQARLPFRIKVLNDRSSYSRCDSAIVYLCASDYDPITTLLASMQFELAPYLRDKVPALTKKLAPGIGVAEDPGNGESFGMHRCRLLADGMIRAFEQGKKSIAERIQNVVERFAEEGVSAEQPFIGPSSNDRYRLPASNGFARLSKEHAVPLDGRKDR